MSLKLQIAADLALPLEAATETFAFIARKGGGKTYAAGKLVELLLAAGVQVVALDVVGNWWGLRVAADGKTPSRFDVPVLGGLRGDIPLEAAGGRLVAETAVATARSMVLDLSQFSLGERKRFAADFGEALWQQKKRQPQPTPLFLVIEESQLIVPQRVGPAEARMVGTFEEIVRLGRNYGIGVAMISQRPQSVNKEVLNQTECLFVGQVNGAQERKALRDWISHQGMSAVLADELPGLRRGTMFVWSPQWLRILRKVEIAPKVTFDASATPKVGDKRQAAAPQPLDLGKLREAMAAAIERARRDDPRELQKENAELRRRIARLEQTGQPAAAATHAEIKRTLEAANRDFAIAEKALRREIGELRAALNKIACAAASAVSVIPSRAPVAEAPRTQAPAPGPVPARAPAPASPLTRATPRTYGTLGRGEMAVLKAVAMYPEGVERDQLTVLTGYKRSSRDTYIQRLTAAGYAEVRGGAVVATPQGVAELGPYFEPLPTGEALQRYWLERLGGGERDILAFALQHGGHPFARQAIDAALPYKRSSRDTYIQRLGARRLIEACGAGEIRAAAALFGPGAK